jgi:hypothetical protein
MGLQTDIPEAELKRSLSDEAVQALTATGGPVDEAIATSERILQKSDYDTENIAAAAPEIDRSGDEVVIRWRWEHPAAEFLEFGTSRHTINGNPVLSFVWEDPPQWVREEFEQARTSGGQFTSGWRVFFSSVTVEGVDELRFARAGLAVLARAVERLSQ